MNILISGYYGFGNEGDELVLAALLRALSPLGAAVTVLSARPAATAARHGVRAAPRWSGPALWRELRACHALISGGGGLLQDLSGPFTPAYYLGLISAATWSGKKVVLVGQGFGPIRRGLNRRLARWVLPAAGLIVARDPEGAAWCRELGVPAANVVLGADLAWTLPPAPRTPGTDWAVCLRADQLGADWPERAARWVGAARRHGRRLRWVALGDRGDRDLLGRLREKFGLACDFRTAPETPAADCFAGTEVVVSMRYHGLLLGSQAGAAVTGFGPDPKLRYLLRELEQPEADPADPGPALAGLAARRDRAAVAAARLTTRAQAGLQAMAARLA